MEKKKRFIFHMSIHLYVLFEIECDTGDIDCRAYPVYIIFIYSSTVNTGQKAVVTMTVC